MRKLAAGGLMGMLSLVCASAAMAAPHNPTGEYAQFADCPLNRATMENCVYSLTTGGSVTIGNKTVPIKNTVTLQGGFEGAGSEIQFYGAEDGKTLSKTAQPVPGGLVGIVAPTWWPKFVQNWFNNLISEGATGVDAVVELAGPTKGLLSNVKLSTENLIFEEGTALQLPAKIHLENAILGSNCYIASDASPMLIPLTSGTSGSLTGSSGSISFNEPIFDITRVKGAKLVNSTFAAPAASGCGGLFSIFVDPLVNTILGTPAGSGSNSAVLEADFEDGAASGVRASE